MTIVRIDLDQLQHLLETYKKVEVNMPLAWHIPNGGITEQFAKVSAAAQIGASHNTGVNQEILDYWYSVDSLRRQADQANREKHQANIALDDAIRQLREYLTVAREIETRSPNGAFWALSYSDFTKQYSDRFTAGTVNAGKYGTFTIVKTVPGDYVVSEETDSTNSLGVLDLKGGIQASVSETVSIRHMDSGLVEVVVTTTVTGMVGLVGDGPDASAGGTSTLTTTYLIEPDQLDQFRRALSSDPLAFVPGLANVSLGPNQAIRALAVDVTNSLGATASVSWSAPSIDSPFLSVSGSAEVSAEQGAMVESSNGSVQTGEYANIHLSAEGGLKLLGGQLADMHGAADVDIRAQATAGDSGLDFKLEGSLTVEGSIAIAGKTFTPPEGYNAVSVEISAELNTHDLPSSIQSDLASKDPSIQIRGIGEALSKGIDISYDVKFGHVVTSTKGFDILVAKSSTTVSHHEWITVKHGEFHV
jgi:hypothetical protein